MIAKLAHVCVTTRDLDKSFYFYGEALGFKKKFEFIEKGKRIGAYFEICRGNYIEIFENKNIEVINTGIQHVCLETDNMDEMIRRFASYGIACTNKILGKDGTYQIMLNDPDGNRIELQEYTKTSAQITGNDVMC